MYFKLGLRFCRVSTFNHSSIVKGTNTRFIRKSCVFDLRRGAVKVTSKEKEICTSEVGRRDNRTGGICFWVFKCSPQKKVGREKGKEEAPDYKKQGSLGIFSWDNNQGYTGDDYKYNIDCVGENSSPEVGVGRHLLFLRRWPDKTQSGRSRSKYTWSIFSASPLQYLPYPYYS